MSDNGTDPRPESMTSAAGAKYIKARASRTCYTTLMALFYTDTSPAMEVLQVQLLRAALPWRKMQMLLD